ncbi:MAG: DNA repair protein RecO [Bdellovibrionaceae bacterium]|jgi:DNA repair protein RecO (recombination protein O)|nr:DNA repair protein RecO [Pseudobdellovibrionaceae bacterium]
MQVKTKAIILKVSKYSDSDLILSVLTEDGQKLFLIAKGARNSKKRFGGGVLEPINLIQFVYKLKNTSQDESTLYFLNEATLLKSFDALRTDYDRLDLVFYFLKMLDKVSFEGNLDSHVLYKLLGNSLLAAEEVKNLRLLKSSFEMKLLYHLGVLPPKLYNEQILSHSIRKVDELKIESSLSVGTLLSEL